MRIAPLPVQNAGLLRLTGAPYCWQYVLAAVLRSGGYSRKELEAKEKDELYKLGITRPGTVGILSNQINHLRGASEDSATLIEHSPYCFGKILDYLRTKRLHALNLIEEVQRPVVDVSQKERFEKVVRYFFPGSQADEIMDKESSSSKKRKRSDES